METLDVPGVRVQGWGAEVAQPPAHGKALAARGVRRFPLALPVEFVLGRPGIPVGWTVEADAVWLRGEARAKAGLDSTELYVTPVRPESAHEFLGRGGRWIEPLVSDEQPESGTCTLTYSPA